MSSNNGYILVKDLPKGTLFAIDCSSWQTDVGFIGMKHVPIGFHVVSASVKDRYANAYGMKSIQYCWVHDNQVIQFHWIEREERLVKMDENSSYPNLLQLDNRLAPYPSEDFKQWLSLTHYISKQILDRTIVNDTIILFDVPKRIINQTDTAADRTHSCLDLSLTLETTLQFNDIALDELQGYIQMSFILFTLRDSIEALQHYWQLIRLLSRSLNVMKSNCEFYCRKLLPVLYFQLQNIDSVNELQCSDEALDDEIGGWSKSVLVFLRDLCNNLDETLCQENDKCRLDKFRQYLIDKYEVDFEYVVDDEQPVIVATI
ncbi:hypothetical protein GJ496_006371 [Pomphorhynchus laevis]|nr:hypothetical protein GJ496_006371 [Pomphorhynchus laevis]